MTLTPSYGRDYKSAVEVKAAFEAIVKSLPASIGPWMGCQCNIQDLKNQGDRSVTLRYAKQED